jgi:hypothetical protein
MPVLPGDPRHEDFNPIHPHNMIKKRRKRSAADRLRLFTDRSIAIHREYLDDPDFLGNYKAFVTWQNNYMSRFYSDFRATKEIAAAVDFVMSDLTGVGISARDQDLARVVPAMTRMLPNKALQTIAVAMELNSRILKINISICRDLCKTSGPASNISERNYYVACRRVGSLDEWLELVELTRQVGHSLNHVVKIPMIGTILRAMRSPARLAGFGTLQDFLETGYHTFTAIKDADQFLEDISERTANVFRKIYEEPLENLAPD